MTQIGQTMYCMTALKKKKLIKNYSGFRFRVMGFCKGLIKENFVCEKILSCDYFIKSAMKQNKGKTDPSQ